MRGADRLAALLDDALRPYLELLRSPDDQNGKIIRGVAARLAAAGVTVAPQPAEAFAESQRFYNEGYAAGRRAADEDHADRDKMCPDCGHPHLPMLEPWEMLGTRVDPMCNWPVGPDACQCRRRTLVAPQPPDAPDVHGDLPPVVVVDENGNYWRAFDGFYSMCPVSTDNDPIKVAAIFQRIPVAQPAPDALPAGWHFFANVDADAKCPTCGFAAWMHDPAQVYLRSMTIRESAADSAAPDALREYGPCPTRLENQPTPSARPWRYGHAASIEGAHWDIYAGEGIDGWLVGMVTTEADAALIVGAVAHQPADDEHRYVEVVDADGDDWYGCICGCYLAQPAPDALRDTRPCTAKDGGPCNGVPHDQHRIWSCFDGEELRAMRDAPDALRDAAQAVVDAWDEDAMPEEDGFDPLVHNIAALRAALGDPIYPVTRNPFEEA